MEKQWFVLHTLTGQEKKAVASIKARIPMERMEEYIGRCEIPSERVVEKKDGKKRTVNKMFFPGYILAEIALYDEARGLDENGRKAIFDRTWQFLRATPGIIGFVGCDIRAGNRPTPLKQSEVDAILLDGPSDKPRAARPNVIFNVDDTVKINDGAFMGLTGQVSMVDSDKGKLKVEVQVFGRKVPVDVEYWQVEKVAIEETLTEAKP